MKRLFTVLVLCPLLAPSAWSQTITFPQPLSQVQQFLGLTDSQVSAILQNNNDYSAFVFQQQRQIQNAQFQIAVETAKDPLDPMTLGTLYAGIESACRELRDRAATTQKQNISILTDAQKTKLNVLNDAMKLAPIISEAQFGNLLGSPISSPLGFCSSLLGCAYSLTGFPPVSGCNVGVRGGVINIYEPLTSNIALADRVATVAPTGTLQPGAAGLSSTSSGTIPLRK
jgi:hypothetical protein